MNIDAKVTLNKMSVADSKYRQVALIDVPKFTITMYMLKEIKSAVFSKTNFGHTYADLAINEHTLVITVTDNSSSYKCHENLINAVKKALYKLDELVERHQEMSSTVENFPEMEYAADEFLEKYK